MRAVAFFFYDKDLMLREDSMSLIDIDMRTKSIQCESTPPIWMVHNDWHLPYSMTQLWDYLQPDCICHVCIVTHSNIRSWCHVPVVLQVLWVQRWMYFVLLSFCKKDEWTLISGSISTANRCNRSSTVVSVCFSLPLGS